MQQYNRKVPVLFSWYLIKLSISGAGARAGTRAAIPICGSADPAEKNIFSSVTLLSGHRKNFKLPKLFFHFIVP
jgi:hypothetical protein